MVNVKAQTENKKDQVKYRSYLYSLRIVRYVSSLPKNGIADVLGKQLLRSGTSVGANVVEAQSGSSKKDFINFYLYALKSANESKFWLCLIRDAKVDSEFKINSLLDETIQIANMIGKSVLTLKGK